METETPVAPHAGNALKDFKEEAGALPPLESLQCKLCQGYFNQPVTLPCMHSFCSECLRKYNGRKSEDEEEAEQRRLELEWKLRMAEKEEDSENAAGQGNRREEPETAPVKQQKPFACPTCKDDLCVAKYSFFAEPFPNDRLARIVKLLHESKILCQNCEASASEFRCSVCDAYTCKSCWDITHAAPIFKGHQPERLTHCEMTAPPKCESHLLNDVEYFCTEDELGVCQVCLLKGEFKGKAYCLVHDVRKTRQEEIEQQVSEALLQRATLIDARKANQATLTALSENLTEQELAVRENFRAIRTALDERETETLEALRALYESKKQVLNGQIKRIDVEKTRIEDGVRNINLVLNHSNDLEVVYLTYVLQSQLDSLTNVPSTSPLPGATDHDPAVDAELPVILSDKVPQLVRAYATVADSSLVEEIATGQTTASVLSEIAGTKEQQNILKQVAGTNVDAADYGCSIQ